MAENDDAKKDVFRIYDDLKRRCLGINDVTKPSEGFVVSFLPAGTPINREDYANPWKPSLTTTKTPDAGAAPGEPDPNAKGLQSLSNLSKLVDRKLELNGSGQVVSGSTSISETWKAIVDGATAVALPPVSAFQRKMLAKATRVLMKPDPDEPDLLIRTNAYTAYVDYMRKYQTAVRNYTAQFRAAMADPGTAQTWPVLGPTYIADVDSAMDDWVTFGKKNEIEDAMNLLGAQGSDAAAAIIKSSKALFRKFQVTTSMFAALTPYVQVFPSNWCEPSTEDDGWLTYTYESAKSNTETSSESTSWGVNAKVNVGLWSVGADAEHSSAHVHEEFSTKGLKISMKYAVADIVRPWLNTTLVNLSNWFLRGHPKHFISDGSIHQDRPPDEAFWLPAIPTQMIVIKGLVIQMDGLESFVDAMSSHVKAGGSVGYGPITLGGRYGKDTSKGSQGWEKTSEGLKVNGAQLIGWISQILGPCPRMEDQKETAPEPETTSESETVLADATPG